MKQDGKLLIAIGSGIIAATLLWDRFIQFVEWWLSTFGHPDQKLGTYAQIALAVGLAFLGRGIYLLGNHASTMRKERDVAEEIATRPENKH